MLLDALHESWDTPDCRAQTGRQLWGGSARVTVAATVDVIRSSVEATAIAIGGLWAAWTFQKLQSVRAADAEINQKIAASRESERRLLSEQPNLEITFSNISEYYSVSSEDATLAISVDVQNSGVRNLQIVFHKASLTVGRVQRFDSSSKALVDVHRMSPYWLPYSGSKLEVMPSRIFRAGQRRSIVFVLAVGTPGLYFVQFQAPYASLPFEGEPVDDEDESLWINAIEERLV